MSLVSIPWPGGRDSSDSPELLAGERRRVALLSRIPNSSGGGTPIPVVLQREVVGLQAVHIRIRPVPLLCQYVVGRVPTVDYFYGNRLRSHDG